MMVAVCIDDCIQIAIERSLMVKHSSNLAAGFK